MDCKEILKMMGLPDYNAWEIVKRTNACLMEDPFWLHFSFDIISIFQYNPSYIFC